MARVFDCFPFFNELDLLEIRLHELSDVVDRFVLAESTVTFSGKPKPLLFAENRQRYAKFLDRIEHIVVDDTPAAVRSPWDRRMHQSNSLARGLKDMNGDDIVIFSDVDEIPRASAVRAAPEYLTTRFDVLCFELRMYNYFVNYESEERWLRSGPRAIRYRNLGRIEPLRKVKGPVPGIVRNAIRGLRAAVEMGRPVQRTLIRDAGWHFTYLGGMEAIINKVKSYAGHETVSQEILDPKRLAARIKSGLSVDVNSNTRLSYRPLDDSFPRYLLENRERFASFILKESGAAPAPRA
jgi:beta-1,4-mannosyl-glycoprotein beta-1,4-N-acetylglucosaminyltransferase